MAFYDNYRKRMKATALGSWIVANENQHIIRTVNKFIKFKHVLEVGGGKGEFARDLQKINKNVTYDVIEPNKYLAKKLREYGNVFICFVPPLPKLDKKYDLIYSSNIIEHIQREKLHDFVSQFHSKLTDKGLLVIQTPNFIDFKYLFWDCDYTHNSPLTVRSITQLLFDTDFSILLIEKTRAGFKNSIPILILNILLKFLYVLNFPFNKRLYKLLLSTSQQVTVYASKN
ncbi:hypothetical protein AC481_00705 [miscellaneous Crenarchaeota group archaeon SMTZ-80]|nr:MAG: hypothetical protein AC481_00705 [miscellaneous Crenarchaeota group archaeon SMTZ-80]